MSNSVIISSSEQIEHVECQDRISSLPDEIIATFLPLIEMKEAVRTSILSKRWRYMWAKRTHLDFDHLLILPDCDPGVLAWDSPATRAVLQSKYIDWVNQVVGLHGSPVIDAFRVRFCFSGSDAHHIENWVRFAISKRVKNLELNLIGIHGLLSIYTLGDDILKSPECDIGIRSLTSIHLTSVDVSGDFLEFVLSQCHLLERLYVEKSATLVSFKVIASSCKLKHLTIRYCPKLDELEINAVNLISFECFSGHQRDGGVNVVFESVPALVEASFRPACIKSIFQKISCFAVQLSKLSLDLRDGYDYSAEVLPSFCNVRCLKVVVRCSFKFNLPAMTRLLQAFPLLNDLKVEVLWEKEDLYDEAFRLALFAEPRNFINVCVHLAEAHRVVLDNMDTVESNVAEHFKPEDMMEDYLDLWRYDNPDVKTHPNLKVLEFKEFNGCNADVGLILHMVGFACNLETIICDPHRIHGSQEIIEASRNRAGKLAKILSSKRVVIM